METGAFTAFVGPTVSPLAYGALTPVRSRLLPDPPQSGSVTPATPNCDECHRMKNRLGLSW
jgi:hypothetical protein